MKRILLIQLRQLGDIILTTPCIRELRKSFPHSQIDFLTHKMGHLILDDNPYLNKVYSYHETDSWLKQLKVLKELRAQSYDVVVDFMYNPRSALWVLFSGAKKRYAFPSRRAWAYTDIVPQLGYSDYIVTEKFELIKALGAQCEDISLSLPWNEKHMGPYLQHKKSLFPDDKTIRVALSPTHRRKERQWPGHLYIELANELQKHGAYVIWIWGPGEEEFVRNLQSQTSSPSMLAPKTSFRELAALLANVDLFIGNSNGPSHVAVSCDTPSIQLHGPTYAVSWCPNTEEHRSIQEEAMTDIKLSQVLGVYNQMSDVLEKTCGARLKKGDRMSWHDDP